MFTKLIERLVTLLTLLVLGVTVFIPARPFGIHIPDPFTHQRVDNSQPPLLKSIQKFSRYHAAQGHYEVVVDEVPQRLTAVDRGPRPLMA